MGRAAEDAVAEGKGAEIMKRRGVTRQWRDVLGALAIGLLAGPLAAAVEVYQIDPVHSSLAFAVRRMMVTLPGSFPKIEGTVTVDRDDWEKCAVEVRVDVGSLSTHHGERDDHLRGEEFFHVALFPQAVFKSTRWKKTGDATYAVTGNLTIKNVTKEITLTVRSNGFAATRRKGMWMSGWEATGSLKRSEFGIGAYPQMIGDEVELRIAVEALMKKPE